MQPYKKISSLFKLILVLLLILSFNSITSCSQKRDAETRETEQPKTEETHKRSANRLTQIKPLNTEVIQDESVLYKCDLQRTGVFKGENPKLKGEVVWNYVFEKEETDPKYIQERSSPMFQPPN